MQVEQLEGKLEEERRSREADSRELATVQVRASCYCTCWCLPWLSKEPGSASRE